MKTQFKTRLLAMAMAVVLLFAVMPVSALAETAEAQNVVDIVQGDVIREFLPAGTLCESSDPAVAWVDEDGTLNAMKPGTVTLSADEGREFTVNVADYTDGSPVVGNLKILARYNDSMQFYDGHVYLLFTSYQDGLEFYVDDLYAYYEISDRYYEDIRENIANGSNHTGSETSDYFARTTLDEPLVLNRGEIVTIGMYRGFDLSVPAAAFGSIKNSSYWADIVAAGKASVIETIFRFLESGTISMEQALSKVKDALAEIGVDYTVALDGVVEGGLCFNRELYNQKLEWDQYENVTYEMDITREQLDTMAMYLGGNLNKFSILKNSCATVALRAWNAAVGTRNGEPGAYYLETTGEGIFALVDAPKTVRDSIVDRLPGYYLNNAEGVAEPDAGYQDETGWVYVSAPEKVEPVTYIFNNEDLVLDTDYTNLSAYLKAVNPDANLTYGKKAPVYNITVNGEMGDTSGSVTSIVISLGDTTVTLDENTDFSEIEDYLWLKTPYIEAAEDECYGLYDDEGNMLSGYYEDGKLWILVDVLPLKFNVVTEKIPEEQPQLNTFIHGDYEADVATEFYRYTDGEKEVIEDNADVVPGEKIYIKAVVGEEEKVKSLDDITMNDESILDSAHYDVQEGAYFIVIPEDEMQVYLVVSYGEIEIAAKHSLVIQAAVGDVLHLSDYVTYMSDGIEKDPAGTMKWRTDGEDSNVALEGDTATVTGAGVQALWACSKSNENIGVAFALEAVESLEDMAVITASDDFLKNMMIAVADEDGNPVSFIPSSGYMVKKGTVLTVVPVQETEKLPLGIYANSTALKAGETFTVTGDTAFRGLFVDAEIKDMPRSVALAAKGDTYQLDAKVSYSGLLQFLPVYDDTVEYASSDPIVSVDENGLVTVEGEVPEEGTLAIVTAYAASGNGKVYAQTKVVVGDYQGERIVGRLTIYARPITEGQLVSHGCLAFTTYEDVDLDVSYYEYYEPNEKYKALMQDYAEHPENYSSDPALYNNNELNLSDRESYFDVHSNGIYSAPAAVSLKAGETVTISNYGFDPSNLTTIYKAFSGTAAMTNRQTYELVEQMMSFEKGEEIDGASAFDNTLATIVYMFVYNRMVGQNPADGHSEGGVAVNREMYNQFRRNDSQMPNNYYTVEITADELAAMKSFLADPENNFYSLFIKNCSTGAVDIWNTALFDKPELHIKANFTTLAVDPMSLYYELLSLSRKTDLDGEAGKNYYPRTVAYPQAVTDASALIDAIGEVEYTPACKEKIDAARAAYEALSEAHKALIGNYDKLVDAESEYRAFEDADLIASGILGDADRDGKVTILDATCIQRVLAGLPVKAYNRYAADVDRDGRETILDATHIQRVLAGLAERGDIGMPLSEIPAAQEIPDEADILAIKKLGEAFALDGDGMYYFGEDCFIYVMTVDDVTYRLLAESSEEKFNAYLELDYEDEDYTQKMQDIIKDANVKIVEIVPLPSQEEIDALIGKTGQQLLDMGYACMGYGYGDDDVPPVFTFDKGFYSFDVTFREPIADRENFDWEKEFKTFTVDSAVFVSFSGGIYQFDE